MDTFPSSVLNLRGETRMLDVVRSGLDWADRANFAISFTRCSGLGLLVDPLEELADRKGRVRLLTSTYQTVTQPAALESLLGMRGVECRVQVGPTGFHSKFWMFREGQRSECWAGSSNLSKGGLADNIEWNLRSVNGSDVALAESQFDALWARPDVRPLSRQLIDQYALQYDQLARAPVSPLPFVEDRGWVTPNAAQLEALKRLAELRASGARRAAIIAATGIGKTFLAAFDCRAAQAKSVLFVSHRKEHLTQAARAFRRVVPEITQRFVTVQSLRSDPGLLAQQWDYLVIDEFHHVEAPSYEPLWAVREKAFLLGLTATPERQDGHDVLEWCDWNVGYEVRLPEAIERKWLLPFHYFAIADETMRDFARIPWRQVRREISLEELEKALSIPERVDLILKHAIAHGFDGPKRATVGFCAGVEHAKYMAKAFGERGQVATAVWGTHSVEEREAVYARLADPADPLEWLFVADVMNEGVDVPAINSLLFLRPTESSSIFLQQLGRGLRLCEGTEVLTVLDFVGHAESAWLTLEALNDIRNTGTQTKVGDFVLKVPQGCEVVLQKKTQLMLEKIRRHVTKREQCDELYEQVKLELGGERAPMPVDLWGRSEGLGLSDFRSAYGDWLACQKAHGDLPTWARRLDEGEPARAFLRAVESDWQQQRVHAYALLWGLASTPDDAEAGYEGFYRRFPQWRPEYEPLDQTSALATIEKKAPGFLARGRLVAAIRNTVGDQLLEQVERRLLHVLNKNHEERHGGVLRRPTDLVLHKFYRRPEIVRHYGVQYDPAKHNAGILPFGDELAILVKLDTSGAKQTHQYENRFLSPREFSWSSQNRMTQANGAGKRVTEHEANGTTIRLFVAESSHAEACYLGPVSFVRAKGDAPMQVTFVFDVPVPSAVMTALTGEQT